MRNNRRSLLFGLQHKLTEGEVTTWWLDVDSKHPRKNIVCVLMFVSAILELEEELVQEPHLPAVPTSFTDVFFSFFPFKFTLSWHQTWHSSHNNGPSCKSQWTVYVRSGLHGEQGGSPKQTPQEAFAL